MRTSDKSILLVSEDPAFTANVVRNIFGADISKVETEAAGFQAVNGRAVKLALDKEVVLFEAQPDNEGELRALSALLKERVGDTVFLAISDNDLSISKARKLREIGVDDVLPISITETELNEVIAGALRTRRGSFTQVQSGQQGELGSVIAVSQARGGVGSTTFAVNLACQLLGDQKRFKKASQKKVALVDFDLQFGNASVFLDLDDNGGFQRMIEDSVIPDARYVQGMMQKHSSGLDLLSAPNTVVPLNSIGVEAMKALIAGLQMEYDYVVVDLPRALVDWLEPVIKATARMNIITDTSIPSIRHAKRLIDFYRETQIGLPIDLVVSREAKPLVKTAHFKQAEAVLETSFAHWLPDDPKIARKSVDIGKPVTLGFQKSALSRAFVKVAKSTVASIDAMSVATN